MLYGKPTKHIRHVDQNEFTLEPERMYVLKLWKYDPAAPARTDGDDILNDKRCPLGSRITRHKIDIQVTPETIEPQRLYIGRIKLSFFDVFSRPVCGGHFEQASFQDTATENFQVDSTHVNLGLYPDDVSSTTITVKGEDTERECGFAGAEMEDWLLDDHMKHWVNMKKVTVFDQRPLMGERWQRIPSKVKRINEGTFYGLVFYNDSTRGATPADTQLTFDVKSYWEEMAI